jgi:hypothetical protein
MTEPTEVDYAAYYAARDRALTDYCDPANTGEKFRQLGYFYYRKCAKAIAEARVQGRREAVDAATELVGAGQGCCCEK